MRRAVLTLTLATALTFGATATTVSAEPAPGLSVADAQVTEGTGPGTTTISFDLSSPALQPVDCGFRAVLSHAAVNGTDNADFVVTIFFDVTAVFDTDDVTVPRTFTISRDATVEPDETMTLTITGDGAVPCTIADGVATGTIINDDSPAPARGYSPGYWKKHVTDWPAPYAPGVALASAGFIAPACAGFSSLDIVPPSGTDTMLQALAYRGGPTLKDKARTLLRTSVAAMLNEAKFGPDYPAGSVEELAAAVNATLATCDRAAYTSLAATFDAWNNPAG